MTQGPLRAVASPALPGFLGGLGAADPRTRAPRRGTFGRPLVPTQRVRVRTLSWAAGRRTFWLRGGGMLGRWSGAPPVGAPGI